MPFVAYRPEERRALGWSFVYFFCLMAGYYAIQPLRDEIGVAGGLDQLSWLFIASMGVMLIANPLFSLISTRRPRRVFIPWVNRFFVINLFLFFIGFEVAPATWQIWIGRFFFLWVSVFNLFVVSVFWSFMADRFTSEQGKRLFGFIGAGGTLGQIGGSACAAWLTPLIGRHALLLIAMVLLEATLKATRAITAGEELMLAPEDRSTVPPASANPEPKSEMESSKPIKAGGSWSDSLSGFRQLALSPYLLGICVFILLYTFTSSLLYFNKAAIVKEALADADQRTAFFGKLNTWVAAVTLFLQVFATGHLLSLLGVSLCLSLVPLITIGGFLGLSAAPMLSVFAVVEITRKAANYSIARPAREVLFTVVSREEKYQAKNLIDTVLYRGGDALAASIFAWVNAIGDPHLLLPKLGLAVSFIWLAVALALGIGQQHREAALNQRLKPVVAE